MKSLLDTDSGQLSNVTPIAGHTELSEISEHFEQDVIDTLETTVGVDESIVWGCNITRLTDSPPFTFGYLVLTSRQLICVKFLSDVERKGSSFELSLPFLIQEMLGVHERSTHPWTHLELSVPYPSQPLTPTEKDSRGVIANDLESLASVRSISSWHKEAVIKSLVVAFEKDTELTLTFYSPHQAEKTQRLLTAQ